MGEEEGDVTHLVTIRDARLFTKEQGAVICHLIERLARVPGQDLNMLKGVFVGNPERLVQVLGDDDLAKGLPRHAGDGRRGQDLQQLVDPLDGLAADVLGVGDEHGRRVWSVLGLRQEVHGTGVGVCGVVGHDEDFGGAGEQVDAHFAVQLALGVGDEGVAGASDEVDFFDRFGPDGHGGDLHEHC